MYESLSQFPSNILYEFDRLQREMEQALGALGLPASIRAVGRGSFPFINIGTSANTVEIYAFVPGIDPAKLEINVERGLLTISGERPRNLPEESDKVTVYADERFSGSFKRVVSLPDDVDLSAIQARYQDGVLRVSIPKGESARPQRIDVK